MITYFYVTTVLIALHCIVVKCQLIVLQHGDFISFTIYSDVLQMISLMVCHQWFRWCLFVWWTCHQWNLKQHKIGMDFPWIYYGLYHQIQLKSNLIFSMELLTNLLTWYPFVWWKMVHFYIVVIKVFKYLETHISWTKLKSQPRINGNKKYTWTAGMENNFSIIIGNIFHSKEEVWGIVII